MEKLTNEELVKQGVIMLDKTSAEYIVVSDTNSKVVFSSASHNLCLAEANRIRKCGGQCTVFKSTKL